MPKIPIPAANEIRKRILNQLMDTFEESAVKEASTLPSTTKTMLQSKTATGLVAERYLQWKEELDNMSDESVRRLFRTEFQTKALPSGVAGVQDKYGPAAPARDLYTPTGQVKRTGPPTVSISPLQSGRSTLSHEVGHSKSDLMSEVRSYVLEVTPGLSQAISKGWRGVNPITKKAAMQIAESSMYGGHPKDPNLAKIVSESVASGYGWVGAKRAGRKPTSVEENVWQLLPDDLKRRIIKTASIVGTTGVAIGATQLGGEGEAEAMPGAIESGASKALPKLTSGIMSSVTKRYSGSEVLGKQVKAVHKGVDPGKRYIEFTDDSFVPISRSEAKSMSINLGYEREMKKFASEVEPEQMTQAYRSLVSRVKAREWTGEGAVGKAKSRMEQIVSEGKGLEVPTSDDVFLYNPKRKQSIPLPRPYYELLKAKNVNLQGFEIVDASSKPITKVTVPLEGTPKTPSELESFVQEELGKRNMNRPRTVVASTRTSVPTGPTEFLPSMQEPLQTSFLPSSSQPAPFRKQIAQMELPLPHIPRLPAKQLDFDFPFSETAPRRSGPSISEQLGLGLEFVPESQRQAYLNRPSDERFLGYGGGRSLFEEYFGGNQ